MPQRIFNIASLASLLILFLMKIKQDRTVVRIWYVLFRVFFYFHVLSQHSKTDIKELSCSTSCDGGKTLVEREDSNINTARQTSRHSAAVPRVMEERLWLKDKTTAAAQTTSRHQTVTRFDLSPQHKTPDSATVHTRCSSGDEIANVNCFTMTSCTYYKVQ